MKYAVLVERAADRSIRRLPGHVRALILATIQELAVEPRPPGCKKLRGFDQHYRVRVGDCRVIYEIIDRELVVIIVNAGPRASVS